MHVHIRWDTYIWHIHIVHVYAYVHIRYMWLPACIHSTCVHMSYVNTYSTCCCQPWHIQPCWYVHIGAHVCQCSGTVPPHMCVNHLYLNQYVDPTSFCTTCRPQFLKQVVQTFLTRHTCWSVPGQTMFEPLVSNKPWSMSGPKARWFNLLVERQVVQTHLWRHSNRALAHTQAHVYTPARLNVPRLAATCTIRLHVRHAYTCAMCTCW